MSSPIEVLREATRAVPAVRYALGVAGILAAVALVRGFGIDARTAVLGAIGMLALMVVLVVFARLTQTAPRHFVKPMLALMWSMLVITVATAALLFSSVFFDWPLAMSRILSDASPRHPAPEAPATEAPSSAADPTIARELAVAQSQQATGDSAGAWATLEALAVAHPAPEVERARAMLAMARLREGAPGPGRAFAELVTPLLPILHRTAALDSGPLGADALAHVGWGRFLLWREASIGGVDPVTSIYREAIARDADNPFAHAMWGHWLLWRAPNLREARRHFDAALASGREGAWVRWMALSAYRNRDLTLDAVRTLIAMQRAGDTLSADEKSSAAKAFTWTSREEWQKLLAEVDARAGLSAFEWVMEGRSFESDAGLAWRRAQLTVAAGECERAKALYDDVIQRKMDVVTEAELRAELAGCKPHA